MGFDNKRTTLADMTYQLIKKDINEHFLLPGEKIKTKELSERYNVSETPIKQALARLTSENLVENIPRQGMWVKSLRWDELEEVFDIRLMMELYFTKEIIIAAKYNPALINAMEENVRDSLELLSGDPQLDTHQKNYMLDHYFHELYLKGSGNKKAVQIYQNLNTHTYSNYIYGRQPKEKTISGINEHRQILNAIKEQDEAALSDTVRLHIYNAKEIVRLLLKVDNLTLEISHDLS